MYLRSLSIFLLITTLAYGSGIALMQQLTGFYHIPVHDEVHFLEAIKLFGAEISLHSLASYNETSGPLPFVLYGLWGRLFGFGAPALRFLSLLLGFTALGLVHYFLYNVIENKKQALAAAFLFAANPYTMALTVLIYTDMAALAFLFAAMIAAKEEKPWLYGFCMALALISRQFFIFFPLAVGVAALLRLVVNRQWAAYKMALASIISTFPLLLLMIVVWGGLCPENAAKAAWVDGMTGFHPRFAILYTSLTAVYVLPLLVVRAREIYQPWIVGFSLAASVLYWIFPPGASPSGLQFGLVFTGFFHRLICLVSSAGWFYHAVMFLFFLVGAPLALGFFREAGRGILERKFDVIFLINLSLVLFYATMPFSYLAWEKYLLPALPLAYASILSLKGAAS
ncbi:hypothetical protein [Desulfatibacillum aliphaticivorans]|uniref:hypothetical protein n=1 Tax=Desulfatibacillum aliphaticivorans TaxID=218208 RepID=UPI00047FA0CA|nr:hypothetical protein [Desulfatibacillum aliphaticivorans]